MKSRTLVLLGIAVGCGILAALLVSQAVGPQPEATVEVPVALKEIPRGTQVKKADEYFRLQAFPKSAVPATAVASLDQLENKMIHRKLEVGQLCMVHDIGDEDSFIADLRDGHLALAVPTNLYNGVAGFIKPEAHVDLLCSYSDPKNGQSMTRIFMTDVRILAVNQSHKVDPSKPNNTVPAVVTLEVNPDEAERLTWAKEHGAVTLALRRHGPHYRPTKGADSPFAPKEEPIPAVLQVPVARQRIEAGTLLGTNVSDYFELKPLPGLNLPANAVTNLDGLRGRTVYSLLAPGQFCTEDHLRGSKQADWFEQRIFNGKLDPLVRRFPMDWTPPSSEAPDINPK